MPNQTMNMNNVNSVSFNNNNVNEIKLNSTTIWPIAPVVEPYLTFSSPNSFTLVTANNTKNWDGTLEYSTDKTTWNTWAGTNAISSSNDGKLYIRGIGNTIVTGSGSNIQWSFSNGNNINISGNIENLLDYATVQNGQHPAMATYCFRRWMYQNTVITDCSNLVLGAETLTDYCYTTMFSRCSNLTKAPSISAITLASNCCNSMLRYCSSLTQAPVLLATKLENQCYTSMFEGCTSLYVSDTQTAEAQHEWRIPTNGVTTGINKHIQNNMFYNCLGTRSSDALAGEIGQQYIYYTQNEPV